MIRTCAAILVTATLAAAGEASGPIDGLFHANPAIRRAARKAVMMDRDKYLGALLLRVEKRVAARFRQSAVIRTYDINDLRQDKLAWVATLKRMRKLDAFVREGQGVLSVHATERNQQVVETLLRAQRRQAATQICLEGRILVMESHKALPASIQRSASHAWIRTHKGVVTAAPMLTARHGEEVEATTRRTVAYLADFDIALAHGAFTADPVIRDVPSGLILRMRPLIVRGKEAISIDIEARIEHVTIAQDRAKRVGAPETRATHVRTTRQVTERELAVIDLGRDSAGRRKVLLLGATVKNEPSRTR